MVVVLPFWNLPNLFSEKKTANTKKKKKTTICPIFPIDFREKENPRHPNTSWEDVWTPKTYLKHLPQIFSKQTQVAVSWCLQAPLQGRRPWDVQKAAFLSPGSGGTFFSPRGNRGMMVVKLWRWKVGPEVVWCLVMGVRVCLFLAVIFSTKWFDMANQAFKSNNYTLAIQHTNGISFVSLGNTFSNVGLVVFGTSY